MIKRTLLAAAIFSALPVYAGLTSITAGYDFTDYSGDHGNRNLAYAELVAKVENATLLFNLSQGRRDYETEHFNATRAYCNRKLGRRSWRRTAALPLSGRPYPPLPRYHRKAPARFQTTRQDVG